MLHEGNVVVFYWNQYAQFWEIGRVTPKTVVLYDLATQCEPVGDGSFLATPGAIIHSRRVRHETFEKLSTEHWDGKPLRIFPIQVHVGLADDRCILPWYITDWDFYDWRCDCLGYLPKRIGYDKMLFETPADAVLARLALR
jgi:hypothetical protein